METGVEMEGKMRVGKVKRRRSRNRNGTLKGKGAGKAGRGAAGRIPGTAAVAIANRKILTI